jgi:hypothetical protein
MTSFSFEEWPEFIENHSPIELNRPLQSKEIAITFVNHATVLIQAAEISILTDPIWSEKKQSL